MAHEVENMFSVRETPWHGLGVKLPAASTTREAIVAAGLDWTVSLHPLFTGEQQAVPAMATRRSTDGRILGVVGPEYHPLQNHEAFAFFDPFLASGQATLETAGSLREGARVWVLAKIARDPAVIVPKSDDKVEKFLLLSNGHDGSLAVRVGFSPIRVVCANTLAMAHKDGGSQLIRVRHTSKVAQTVEALREVMNLADQKFEATAEQYRRLAARDLHEADLALYVNRVFAATKDDDLDEATERKTEHKRLLASITDLFETGRGNNLPGVRGTLWGAYNAVTEYLGYERGSNDAVRLDSAWFGQSAARNRRALDIAIKMAA